ncbi:MAG: hypothetical protein HRU09_19805 [Oligoflexales bacterium]|nr:hypothetical protein [Oligoflexales bacterium]
MIEKRIPKSLSLFVSLGLSVFIHLILLQLRFEARPISPKLSQRQIQKIRVHIPTKKTKVSPLRSKQKPKQAKQKAGRKPLAAKTKQPTDPVEKKNKAWNIPGYEQLLPSQAMQAPFKEESDTSIGGKSLAQVLGGEVYQELELDASALRFLIFIPYYVREYFSKETSSRAIVFLTSDGSLLVKSLSGQAILRAVLFESLTKPEGKLHLSKIFGHLGVSTLSIDLKLIPRIAVDGGSLTHEYNTVLGAKGLSYEVFYDMSADRGGNLSDSFVEKDKAWDREKLRELKGSVAYKRSIRNFTL